MYTILLNIFENVAANSLSAYCAVAANSRATLWAFRSKICEPYGDTGLLQHREREREKEDILEDCGREKENKQKQTTFTTLTHTHTRTHAHTHTHTHAGLRSQGIVSASRSAACGRRIYHLRAPKKKQLCWSSEQATVKPGGIFSDRLLIVCKNFSWTCAAQYCAYIVWIQISRLIQSWTATFQIANEATLTKPYLPPHILEVCRVE
jgi:hypothetical protein